MGLVLKQWVLALVELVAKKKKKVLCCTRWLYLQTEVTKETKWWSCQNERKNERKKDEKDGRAREKRAAVFECVHVKPRQLLASFILH